MIDIPNGGSKLGKFSAYEVVLEAIHGLVGSVGDSSFAQRYLAMAYALVSSAKARLAHMREVPVGEAPSEGASEFFLEWAKHLNKELADQARVEMTLRYPSSGEPALVAGSPPEKAADICVRLCVLWMSGDGEELTWAHYFGWAAAAVLEVAEDQEWQVDLPVLPEDFTKTINVCRGEIRKATDRGPLPPGKRGHLPPLTIEEFGAGGSP